MVATRSRTFAFWLLFGGLAATSLGCELIASVDRSEIEEDSGAATEPDATVADARPDVSVAPDGGGGSDAAPDVTAEVGPDASLDAPAEVSGEASADAQLDAQPDVAPDAQPDVNADAPADAETDVVPDADPCASVTCPDCQTCGADGGCVPVLAGTNCATDSNVCTIDKCDNSGACTHVAVSKAADCGSKECGSSACYSECGPCTGNLVCDPGGTQICVDLCAGVTCTASNQCHVAGTCDQATGVCSNPAKTDGSACTDGDACTQTDTCQAGACTGTNPVTCTASDQCHVAICITATGLCSDSPKGDGAACSTGSACSAGGDSCQGGACSIGTPVVCEAGACDDVTGCL
jgi:hypothetical protein